MAKSVVFHIGDPKTGSSSIQRALFSGNWSCPSLTVEYTKQPSSFPIANALAAPVNAAKKNKILMKAKHWLDNSAADLCILSAEQFCRVDPVELNSAIAEFMPSHLASARVVAYVRPHTQRFIASFMQRVKTGGFFDDMENFFAHTLKQQTFFFAPRFSSWKSVFGNRFILRPMVRDELLNGDVVADFLNTVLEGAPFNLPASDIRNESLSTETLSGWREVQLILKQGNVSSKVRHAIGGYMGYALNETKGAKATKWRLDPGLYDKIAKTYREDARSLDREFFEGQIMERALDAASADLAETTLRIDAAYHLSSEAIAAVQERGRALLALLEEDSMSWRTKYAREKGQTLKPARKKARKLAEKSNADTVQAVLDDLARTIINQTLPPGPGSNAL